LRPSCFLPSLRIMCWRRGRILWASSWDPPCSRLCILCRLGPKLSFCASCANCSGPSRGVGRTDSEPPNLQINPDEYGGTARAPKGQARELMSSLAPGEGSRVWSEAPMQWTLCSRGSIPGCSCSHPVDSHPSARPRPEAPIASCDQGFVTSIERMDSGSTTRRATVHSLWSGLKIEYPKAREVPRVIIFRPCLENRGGSVATAMVQLLKSKRNEAGSEVCSLRHLRARLTLHLVGFSR